MQEYTETEAYKHLLSVAENIIDSLQTDPNILHKYHTLKAALLNKITQDPLNQQLAHSRKLLSTYKYIISSLLQILSEFENQIETNMERTSYSRTVIGVVKEWEIRLEDLKSNAEGLSQKSKLIAKDETSSLGYYCAQLDGKLQNLGLLIQVHKKMHEIIQQAARSESDRGRREESLESNIQQLQRELQGVREARSFVQQHQLTEKQYKEFKVWSSKLTPLLFS